MTKDPRHRNVLMGTGCLVANFFQADQHHSLCVETLREITPPLLTTWPVLTETAWILRNEPKALEHLYRPEGLFTVVHQVDEHLMKMYAILKRYRNLSPQLADASLVQLAEERGLETTV